MNIGDTVKINDNDPTYVGWEGILVDPIGDYGWTVKFEQVDVPLPFRVSELDLVDRVTAPLA